MKAGDLIELTDTHCIEEKGTWGVLVNSPSLKEDNVSLLCLIFENGNYIYFSSEIPLNVIGYAPRYVGSADKWKSFVNDISLSGLGETVHVLAWQSEGSGGFDWSTSLPIIKKEYEQEKYNCVKYVLYNRECCWLYYIVSSLDTAEDEIDRSLWENKFDGYPNHYTEVLSGEKNLIACKQVVLNGAPYP